MFMLKNRVYKVLNEKNKLLKKCGGLQFSQPPLNLPQLGGDFTTTTTNKSVSTWCTMMRSWLHLYGGSGDWIVIRVFFFVFFTLLLTTAVCAQPTLEELRLQGPVKSVTSESIALSHKLRNWFSGPETSVELTPNIEDLREAVKKDALLGTFYKQRYLEFTASGKLQKEIITRGDGALDHKRVYYFIDDIHCVSMEYKDARPILNKTHIYENDERGRHIKRIEKNSEEEVTRIWEFEYDDERMVKKLEKNPDGSLRNYWVLKYTPEGQIKTNTHYNAKDEFQVEREWVYNEDGHMTLEMIRNKNGTVTGDFRFTPDENGRPVEEEFFTASGGVEIRWEYEYDSHGFRSSFEAWNRKGQGGRTEWKEFDYVYDAQGNWIKKFEYAIHSDWGRKIRTPVEAVRREIAYFPEEISHSAGE